MNRIATIGFFDGVHKGHQYLFAQLQRFARERGLEPLIVTFAEHPRAVLQSDYIPRLLTTLEERKTLLEAYGKVVVMPFESVQPLTAAGFPQLLHDDYRVEVLLMGYDHQFGADRLKHPKDYRNAGTACGVEVLTMGEYIDGEWNVSSTEIRRALENGNITIANELLGRPYGFCGTVVHGKAIGRTIGFPTANIVPLDPCRIIPKEGVYEVQVQGEGLKAKGFCNIDPQQTIEVHIPSYEGNLYGCQLEIRFLRFLREERKFDNLEELQAQIKDDIDSILRPL